MRSRRQGRAPCLATLLCALAIAAPCSAAREPAPLPLDIDLDADGWPVPEFLLVDQNGDKLTRQQLLGQWSFVLFGDTRCASPCTTGLVAMSALRARIAGARVVQSTQFLFVSLDPVRDDAARLKAYLAPYGPGFVAATGTAQMLKVLADELGATHRIGRASGHDGSLVLIDPQGNVRAVYLAPYDVRLLTADYLIRRARRR